MPLREISNNSRHSVRGNNVDKKTPKQATRKRPKLPLAASALANHAGGAGAPRPVGDEAPLVHSNPIVQPFSPLEAKELAIAGSKKTTSEVFVPSSIFLHSVNEWCMVVSGDTERWSASPHFKQEEAHSSCLLCGKTIRGLHMNEKLIHKHVKGSHHKKTYQLLENLKQLRKADEARFHELISTLSEAELLPASNFTLKQLLAYYHNVTIQGLQSRKPLDGIVSHFKRRFLLDKIQSEVAEKQQPVNVTEFNSLVEEAVPVSDGLSRELSTDPNINVEQTVGNEENAGAGAFLSPLSKTRESQQRQTTDTPLVANSNKQGTTDADPSLPGFPIDDKNQKRLCESPSSDISVQSELQWMGPINELDDMLDNNHNMFDGSLDDELQKMIDDDDVGNLCLMGMPMMVVTPLDNSEEGSEFFENGVEIIFHALEHTGESKESDRTSMSNVFATPAETATVHVINPCVDPLLSDENDEACSALIEVPAEEECAQSLLTDERQLEIERSLECIAALASVIGV